MNMSAIEVMEDALRELGSEDQAAIFFDIRDYHNVSDVAALARDANVERLALNHLTPHVQGRALDCLFVDPIREVYDGEIRAGDNRLTIVISARMNSRAHRGQPACLDAPNISHGFSGVATSRSGTAGAPRSPARVHDRPQTQQHRHRGR